MPIPALLIYPAKSDLLHHKVLIKNGKSGFIVLIIVKKVWESERIQHER